MSKARIMNLSLPRTAICAWLGLVAACPMFACSGSDANADMPPAVTNGAPGNGVAPGEVAPGTTPGDTTPSDPSAPGAAVDAPSTAPAAVPPSAEQPTEANAQDDTPLQPPAQEGETPAGEATGAADGRVPLDPALLSRCTGQNPIVCTIDAPNGNYDVSVEVGNQNAAGLSRVSAETRHYAGAAIATAAGAFSVATFTVNVRAEVHDGGQSAPGNVLNLLIDGDAPQLHGIGIRPAPSSVTVFIASDSTACDWVSTNTSALAPDETGWGQALSMYLKPGVAVADYADSGETSGSFYGKFFPPARAAMKAGDFLLIQFGHNNKSDADIARYGADLSRYIDDARAKNVTPVIVTPVSRSSGTAQAPGFNNLDEVARDLAAREDVALIDLTALSRTFYTTVPSKNALFIDGTHFHEDGAIGVAGVVARALKDSGLGLASFVK
jgi:lysophospholipase L1-like esterase